MEIRRVPLSQIVPYENNPRRNDEAVDAVTESIRQCGYCAPIVVDENMIVLAGHTRLKALKRLAYTEADVVVRGGLTEEQKRKYRLLDNKTGEFAGWDFEKLEAELNGLDFSGFDFGFDMSKAGDDYFESFFTPQTEERSKDETETTGAEEHTFDPEPKQIKCPHCGMWFTP